jgi:hypothetical protein
MSTPRSGAQAGVLVDVHGQGRDAAIDGEPPVAIIFGSYVKGDELRVFYIRHGR